jgi:hypothetical protein
MAMRLLPRSIASADLRAATGSAAVIKSPFPGYLTPQDLHAAYSLPTETASSSLQTIAVIDAFDDPSAEADLGVYDRQFGLPECTHANGCFAKINQEGNPSPLPAKEGEWAAEISIDVQMAHAICQSCRVLLVEANSETFTDLGAAVNEAVSKGASEISNSYGAPERPSYTPYISRFYNHPGVVVAASSGDCGYLNQACPEEVSAAEFPADSPDVLAVGGTSLSDTKKTWESTVWEEGGSGCSHLFAAPAWQSSLATFSATGCGSGRSVADVAAIGDPNTGVDVYDSTPEGNGEPTGWTVFGGTSVSSPIIAAEFGLAGGAHGVSYPAETLYSYLGNSDALYDVVSGSNGSCSGTTACQAVPGYDGPSGVGSPTGLDAFAIPGSPVSTSTPTVVGVAEQGQTLSVIPGAWSGDPSSISDQWEDCHSTGWGCSAITDAHADTYTLQASDVGSTIRVQETASNAAGAGAPTLSTQTATTVSDVPTITSFTPTATITGASVSIDGTALNEASQVKFGALTASFKVLSPTQIQATVPNGSHSGRVSVSTPLGTATGKGSFTPTLSVTSFTPKSGPVGRLVTITGVGFNASSKVRFDGVAAASVIYVSSKTLKAIVPMGAKRGAVTVTNKVTPVGTVSGAGVFAPT